MGGSLRLPRNYLLPVTRPSRRGSRYHSHASTGGYADDGDDFDASTLSGEMKPHSTSSYRGGKNGHRTLAALLLCAGALIYSSTSFDGTGVVGRRLSLHGKDRQLGVVKSYMSKTNYDQKPITRPPQEQQQQQQQKQPVAADHDNEKTDDGETNENDGSNEESTQEKADAKDEDEAEPKSEPEPERPPDLLRSTATTEEPKQELAARRVKEKKTNQNRYQPPGDCRVLQGLPPLTKVEPTITASYPGSGAKMSWNLITGLTGTQTGDDHHLNGVDWSDAVTVKTHFPHVQGNPELGKLFDEKKLKQTFPRTLMIMRNPAYAIASYHNFLYEQENNLPGHSTRAPVDVWIQWRDEHFVEEMDRWIEHTRFWSEAYGNGFGGMSLDKTTVERRIVTFEGLVADESGPANALTLAQLLNFADGIDAIVDEGVVECIWNKVIKYKGNDGPVHGGADDIETHREGDSNRPYTVEQYDYMMRKMHELMEGSAMQDRQLKPILGSYIGNIMSEKRQLLVELSRMTSQVIKEE